MAAADEGMWNETEGADSAFDLSVLLPVHFFVLPPGYLYVRGIPHQINSVKELEVLSNCKISAYKRATETTQKLLKIIVNILSIPQIQLVGFRLTEKLLILLFSFYL